MKSLVDTPFSLRTDGVTSITKSTTSRTHLTLRTPTTFGGPLISVSSLMAAATFWAAPRPRILRMVRIAAPPPDTYWVGCSTSFIPDPPHPSHTRSAVGPTSSRTVVAEHSSSMQVRRPSHRFYALSSVGPTFPRTVAAEHSGISRPAAVVVWT